MSGMDSEGPHIIIAKSVSKVPVTLLHDPANAESPFAVAIGDISNSYKLYYGTEPAAKTVYDAIDGEIVEAVKMQMAGMMQEFQARIDAKIDEKVQPLQASKRKER